MLFVAQICSYRWWCCHVERAQDTEKRQPDCTGLSLPRCWNLPGRFTGSHYHYLCKNWKDHRLSTEAKHILPRVFLPCFTIQCILLFLFLRQYFPASFVSCYPVYLQRIFYSDTFKWNHQTCSLGKQGLVYPLRTLWEAQSHSQCNLQTRQSWWCYRGWVERALIQTISAVQIT